MSLKLRDIVGNIFHTKEKEETESNNATLNAQNKVNQVYGINPSLKKEYNPFLKRNGELVNPYIDYQKLLDNPNTSSTIKKYIKNATGLIPTEVEQPTVNIATQNNVTNGSVNKVTNKATGETTPVATHTTPTQKNVGTGEFKNLVGQRITDTSKYNNGAAKGQCVWYALGRATERNGKNITIGGNGNSMYYQAKKESQLSATPDNLKGNTLLCYNKGTSSAGQKYGHVIFIEDVVGDTVYYTEGGSGYYKNGTDGVIKTATKEQILQGVNSAGSRIGSEPVGLIDLSKY